MVHMMKPGGSRPDRDVTTTSSSFSSAASKVKREILDDPSEDPRCILSKRPKTSSLAVEEYNPLNEPSPLGLSLRKSPSLLDLIQMRLSQGNAQKIEDQGIAPSKKESKSAAGPSAVDKLKASNFPGSLLKIGAWEYKSRYEGDLVAKCYFAKHKLVWEILEGGLKSKIEIQWSDIMALKANCSEDEPGTLNVVLARQPLFFRETNPQPRKHTLWQATADFTKGQASIHRQHFLECPPGLLTKHFEKLIQCDMRLNFLSRQPEISLDSPYFEQRASVFEDPLDLKTQDEAGKGPSLSSLEDLASPSAAPSSSYEHEKRDPAGSSSAPISHEPLSPISADERGNCDAVDSKMTRDWEQIKVPGLHPSMSMSDLMNHIGNCITEQRTAGNLSISADGSEHELILEDIAQYLLCDTQLTSSSDEKRLMARVNSLYCLLQKDPGSTQNLQALGESYAQESDQGIGVQLDQAYELPSSSDEKRLMARVNSLYCLLQKDPGSTQNLQALGESLAQESDRGIGVQLDQAYELPSSITSKNKPDLNNPEDNTKDVSCSKPVSGMSRKDSFGDLLLHLPRIASLPKFLFNISE